MFVCRDCRLRRYLSVSLTLQVDNESKRSPGREVTFERGIIARGIIQSLQLRNTVAVAYGKQGI